jgi:PH (Pleckstrin Homology) domain-containing protein
VLAWVVALVFFIMGVVMTASSPGNGGTLGVVFGVAIGVYVALGVFVVLVSLWLGALLVTNGLTVTSDGLANRLNLRRRLIGWPEVDSFTVGPGDRWRKYPTLIICLTDGSRVLTSVTSYTAKYPSQVARELTALQASATSAPRPPTL